MKKQEPIIGILLLLASLAVNLWVYRLEPTALVDPNDNTFQFALVERTNRILDFAGNQCTGSTKPFCVAAYLVDHWVPNWAQGYNLPYYYSHVPQVILVLTYRILHLIFPDFALFTYYHIVIYLLLSLFPVSVAFALRTIGLSWLVAGTGALISSHLSTDGLYGLDPTSFVWRGYGLSSQLFAMIWLPLAIAFAYRGRVLPSILTLAATTAGHLGIGIIGFMSVGVMFLSHVRSLGNVKENLKKLILTYGSVVLLLGYWILPILIHGDYHNISVWDGIWKFDSFGYREVLKNLLNGDLFDFGRLPILTLLVFLGVFSSLFTLHYSPFGLLFVFWLLLYFGRATWGGLFTLIPGMSEFHLSRFIVGVHAAGLFLIPIGFQWVIEQISRFGYVRRSRYARFLVTFGILVVLVILVYPQTLRYASHNDFLITQANNNYRKDVADNKLLIRTLRTKIAANPGRVFAGRGGAWGKDFRIAETPMYMHLSTYGIPVILWLPETWSPNSDTEQYFSENNPDHYSLYNVRYIVTPVTLPKESIQPFWKLTESGKTWKLYEVETGGYIAAGVRPAVVSSSKTDYRSLVRLWMHGGYIQKGLYPELTFDRNYPKQTGLPNFRMLDEVTYHVPDGSVHNLFAEVPRYISPARDPNSRPAVRILSQSNDSDMVFRAKVEVPPGCSGCITLLKQSYHPSWKAMINGKPAPTFAVFPFYIAVPTETAGTYDIEFAYRPSPLKLLLLFLPLLACTALLVIILRAGKRP